MEKERRVKRNYVFTEKQLKEKLKMVGDIESMGIWSGRSPQMIEDGITQEDYDCWFIETEDLELEDKDDSQS
ncbi:hypothetical protein LCGC14_1164830 [marine sediment metagenome]|uniref:Uncharacterized protein n=1 Tax=marine sediment metagenome TaxID=412755 RepID=A0A0F9LWP2_9ZZZZ